jgi:hypothetical protein
MEFIASAGDGGSRIYVSVMVLRQLTRGNNRAGCAERSLVINVA